jgi:hypothetical protein
MPAIVYVTTNLVNGKKYLGKHSGKRIDYLGSGLGIKRAIKKYGKNNFIREVVAECSTDQEAFDVEESLSKKWNVVSDPKWYNNTIGGKGFQSGLGHPYFGKPLPKDQIRKIAIARRARQPEICLKLKESGIRAWSDPNTRQKIKDSMNTERAIRNRSDAGKKRYDDPIERQQQSLRMKLRYENTSERQKTSEAGKLGWIKRRRRGSDVLFK